MRTLSSTLQYPKPRQMSSLFIRPPLAADPAGAHHQSPHRSTPGIYTAARLNARIFPANTCTGSPSWFNVVLRTFTMPWFGFERDGSISTISKPYLHNALVRFRARRQYFDDLAFHPQNIASARGPWPSDIPAQTDDARGERQSGCDQEPHGDRGGVPAARRQSPKDAGLGSRFIQVERLRIELRGERFDTILVYLIHP